MDTDVRGQYEAYPYPPRDPADEAKRLITGSPSNIVEIEHYVFGRKLAADQPFRALVAGGGTGDATIMLASQLAARGLMAEITHIDISGASLEIARARAAARKLDSINFIQASLNDLTELGLEKFDYIDCCGVLHHLPEPAAGLHSLVAALRPKGGIGLMLYGRLGRTGVYEAQDLLRLIADDLPDTERVETARALLDDLPPTNWLKRNSHIGDHHNAGDAGIYDLLLHRQDRAYSVAEIFALAADAELEITGFIEPARYDPLNYLEDAALRQKAASLPWPQRCAAAELIAGNLKVHICYLVNSGRGGDIPRRPQSQMAVPVLNNVSPEALAGRLKGAPAISLDFDGAKIRLPLPKLAAEISAQINGERNLAEIRRRLAKAGHRLSASAFARQFEVLYKALNGINALLLR
ncbi:MAG: class I SAM-dependent methyltransferase [Rhodospirillaceae bacterium]|nr:class I SAM-dependent methyltransferase [Rhodospirillaceae bacterium]MBT4425557.1 class I SAM-dependent methyltransferase [Rhodospirillaceae bacterium]